MFCNLQPRYGRDYWMGDLAWTRRPGKFTSEAIAQDKYRDRVEAGEFIASHVAVITGPNRIVEATTPVVRAWPLSEYVRETGTLLWVKRPLGQTRASACAMACFAEDHKGEPYDLSAIVGMYFSDEDDVGTEPNPLADDDEWICSRLGDMALRTTEALRTVALPQSFKRVSPTWRTPQGLLDQPVWQPAVGLPPA